MLEYPIVTTMATSIQLPTTIISRPRENQFGKSEICMSRSVNINLLNMVTEFISFTMLFLKYFLCENVLFTLAKENA